MCAYYTQARYRANQKYLKAHYEQIAIRVPKGKREVYNRYAEGRNISLTKLMMDLLEKEMEEHPLQEPQGTRPAETDGDRG